MDERKRPDRGFTLIELLVVLVILGLLTALATPQVLKYLDNAKLSSAKIQVESLSGALELFKLSEGRYPTNEEGLSALVKAPPSLPNWNGPYIKRGASLEDPWGKTYNYKNPGEHADVDVYAVGPNGKPIGNW